MSNLKSRLLGLVTTLALVAFVVGTPLLLLVVGAVPAPGDFGWARLTSPDDGTLALAVIGVVAWLAWLVMTASLALAAIARVRGIRPPTLPGLAVLQLAAGRLIATASLLFIAVPTAAQSQSAPPAEAHELPAALVHEPASITPASAPASDAQAHQPRAKDPPATVRYTVKRGDSLWKIAQERLGDGTRYTEILDLNPDVLGGRPDFITPGTVLLIPEEQTGSSDTPTRAGTYVVEPGDTLSEIAEETLGDASRYAEILTASEHTRQPDGVHLRNPDLIRPGWRLTIPGDDGAAPSPAKKRAARRTVDPPAHSSVRPTPRGTKPGLVASPEPHPDQAARDGAAHHVDHADTVSPGWVVPGLTASGALLAGALLLVLRRHRRTQVRFRRPGHVISPPPSGLRPVEKTVHLSGTTTAPQLEHLDAMLRTLADALGSPPPLNAVELHHDRVTLHLVDHAQLPTPWRGAATRWTRDLDDTTEPTQGDRPAPYPLLASLGQDKDGHLWLLNLEQLGSVSLTGDADHAEALARHVAAELALNPWAGLVDVDLLGVAPELAPLDPLRLHHHEHGDTAFLDRLEADLQPDSHFDHAQPDAFHALIAGGEHLDAQALRKVIKIITTHPGRPGAAVITVNADPTPTDRHLTVTSDGHLNCEELGLDIVASGLTAAEAAACAAIVDVTRDATAAPTPADGTPDGDLAALTDAGGALRTEFTAARPNGPAGHDSLLPLAAEQYEDASTTTAEDVATLAPLTPASTRSRVEEADPTLDEDLELWYDPESPLPRLTLLGPVTARTRGDARAVATRKPFYVELLSFLALHPSGVTSEEVAAAFGLSTDRVAVDLKAVRSWLGVNPRTGTHHLPHAKKSRAAKARGIAAYQVDDLLIDWDLFRRLRARGQARGAEGIDDLSAALKLVTGEPFTHLRPAGWNWLLDGDRQDHIATCAVVDIAHIVTTRALAEDNLDLARVAAETAYRAAPDDETSRLDLIQVAAASGHTELAERQLIDAIFNRSDDDLGPVEVPERTTRIVGQRGWDRTRHTSGR